uniref:Acid sensing ion channel subunit 1 n=1 Tax=Meleagris gallopavo TaxID=9103 RepID=A0A803YE79_MELGA
MQLCPGTSVPPCRACAKYPEMEEGSRQRPWSLEEFSRRSTLHGIQHIFQHRRYTTRNLLWLLAFLGSLALLIHVYTKCVGLYFQYPHSTQLEEEMERNKTFPAVTLCNLNPARFSRLSSHDLYWAGEMLGLLDGAGRPLMHEGTEQDVLVALRGKLDLSEEEKSRPFDFVEFVERVSHRLELGEMLVRCTFGGRDCSSSDFQTVMVLPCQVPGSWPGTRKTLHGPMYLCCSVPVHSPCSISSAPMVLQSLG